MKARKEEKTKQAFLLYQQEPFYEQEGSENSAMDCMHVKPITPLDQLSPRHSRRRTDSILALVREEAEKQQISSIQLLGYLLHRYRYFTIAYIS